MHFRTMSMAIYWWNMPNIIRRLTKPGQVLSCDTRIAFDRSSLDHFSDTGRFGKPRTKGEMEAIG